MALVVGLTGGIGSGKSRIAALFRELGVALMDADHLARELVVPGSPALGEIVAHFGGGVLHPGGELNRQAMRQRIFADPQAKEQLEQILHPRIATAMAQWAAAQAADYVIQVVPLLLEKGLQHALDRVLVVDCAEDQQLRRVVERDRISQAEAQAIMDTQLSRSQRLALADDVLTNLDGDQGQREAVLALHKKYRSLAHNRAARFAPPGGDGAQ